MFHLSRGGQTVNKKELLDRCEAYLVLPLETRKLYNDLWTELGI